MATPTSVAAQILRVHALTTVRVAGVPTPMCKQCGTRYSTDPVVYASDHTMHQVAMMVAAGVVTESVEYGVQVPGGEPLTMTTLSTAETLARQINRSVMRRTAGKWSLHSTPRRRAPLVYASRSAAQQADLDAAAAREVSNSGLRAATAQARELVSA